MKLSQLVLRISILVLITSCTSGSLASLTTVERLLSFPPGRYDHLVYLDGKIIGFATDVNAPKEKQVSFAHEGDTERVIFLPEDDPNCKGFTLFRVVSPLPDGRLGLFKECQRDKGLIATKAIFAYDWHSRKIDHLVAGTFSLFGPNYFTWHPDMTIGVQSTGPGYPGTIYWIKSDGISPMDIEIEDRGLTWNLKDYYEGKERTGGVRHPAWSTDGKTIAFFATTYGILEEPKPKFNVNYDLFFMDPATLKPMLELMDVADAGKIVWSPNNEYILFRGCIGPRLTCGLWRYKISNKSLSLIKEGEFSDYIWIKDEKIVAARFTDLTYNESQVWEYSILE